MGSWGHPAKGVSDQHHSPLETSDWAALKKAAEEELFWRNKDEYAIRAEMERRIEIWLARLDVRRVRRTFPRPMKRDR